MTNGRVRKKSAARRVVPGKVANKAGGSKKTINQKSAVADKSLTAKRRTAKSKKS